MRHRLLDLLACPNDGHFPLEIRDETADRAPAKVVPCETYCSKFKVPVEKQPVDPRDCADCSTFDIVAGALICAKCGREFDITDGIPDMLPDGMVYREAPDKKNELMARDDQAERYDSLAMLKILSRLELPAVLAFLSPQKDDLVVELGAGTGRITSEVAARVSEIVAVDFSIQSLRRSRAKFDGLNAHWVQADINHLPLKDHVGDHVLSCQVFEHLPGSAYRNKAVDEAARVVKAGGGFVISVYRDSWLWRLFGPKEGYHSGGIYYYRMSGQEFLDMLSRQFVVKQMVPNLGFYLQLAKCVKTV